MSWFNRDPRQMKHVLNKNSAWKNKDTGIVLIKKSLHYSDQKQDVDYYACHRNARLF